MSIVDKLKQESERILRAAGADPESRYEVPSYTQPQRKPKPVARVFPRHVRETLIAASRVDVLKGPGESINRTLAVEHAIRVARRECPGLFSNDKE